MAYLTDTNKLKVTELDFDSIKEALKTFLKGQETFKDYNFEGSAINILLDVLAYNTHYNGFYTNMLASEMFMDSAALRSSVVSLAKQLGYTPASRKGATATIDFTHTAAVADAANARTLPISRYDKFTTKIEDNIYTFLVTESSVGILGSDNQTYTFSNIKLKEGVYFTSSYAADGDVGQRFAVPNENVDIDTLVVMKAGEVYNRADDITEIKSTDKVYFVQEGRDGLYEIYFGDGVVGVSPKNGETVQIDYMISMLGEAGNGVKTFNLAKVIGGSDYTYGPPTGAVSIAGAERETTETVRLQAPRQYALQKRAVSADDYRARLKNDYSIVDSVRVWGGEDNDPPAYGKVFISVKPKDGYVLSDSERKSIVEDILKKRNVVTITPEFVDPTYLNLVLDCSITYDQRETTRNSSDLELLVSTAVAGYNTNNLGKFDQYYQNSVLTKQIDSSEDSIKNSLVGVKIKSSFRPTLGSKEVHVINFNNPLYHPHDRHMSILESTKFTLGGFDNCSFYDQSGKIYIKRQLSSGGQQATTSSPGIPGNLTNAPVGTIDYETGKVTIDHNITSIDDRSVYVYLTVIPRSKNIISEQNTILTIDSADISITMNEESTIVESNKVQGY